MVGAISILCSFGYLILAFKSKSYQEPSSGKSDTDEKENNNHPEEKYNFLQWSFMIIMALFFFFYVGADVSYFYYLTTFSVKSALGLSKQSGAKVTAIFNGSFAVARFLNIFIAIALKPLHVMLTSCIVSCLASLVLVLYADKNVLILQIASAFQGFGMAAIYPTGNFVLYSKW